jgi:glycosyltransferase involved in cell wall biosynthesis
VISFLSRANYTNIIATYFGSDHRCIISERNTPSLVYKSRSISDIVNLSLVRRLFPSSERIIAVSIGVQKDLVKNFNIPEEKVTVIYNPYNIDDIKKKSKEEIKHKWLNHQEYKTVVTVGRLEKQKNHSLLIKAFNKATEKLPNIRLIIIGEGSEREKLTKLVSQLDLDNKIEFTGEKTNPFKYLSRADLFVLSSDMEGFPNVLIEAMICGCPVISTDCQSGPNEIIRNTQNGYLVPVGDIDSLSQTIVDVLQNDNLRTELKNKARETVNKFELTKIVPQYYQTLTQD